MRLEYITLFCRLPQPIVHRLEWNLDEAFHDEVLLPQRDAYDARRDALEVNCLTEVGRQTLTRRLCDRTGVSPDAMMQLAFVVSLLYYLSQSNE